MIVHSSTPMIVIGGGHVSAEDLDLVRSLDHEVVAADGGALTCLAVGIAPRAVIGDLDSLGGAALEIPSDRLHRIPEQETTDFDKCLRSIEAPLILAFGVTGPRIDHLFAVCTTLVRRAAVPAVVVGEADLLFHAPPELALDLPPGSRFSLFPMAPVGGRSEGLRWPIDGLVFTPLGRIGTSNEVVGPVRLAFDAPGMLVITPREALAQVSAALAGSPRAPAG